MVATTVATTLTPTQTIRQFRGVSREQATVGPRAEIIFHMLSGAVAEAGAADADQSVTVNCVLPQNYAHALVDCSFRLFSNTNAVAMGFDLCGLAVMNNASSNQDQAFTMNMCSPGLVPDLVVNRGSVVYTLDVFPKAIFHPRTSADQVQLQVTAVNENLNGPAVTAVFYARFLQYDILQSDNYTVNWPTLVR